ncbi:MAG: conjugal transfer protein TraR [Ignavibacteriales bacterium]|nr:MAG: conjugal transfer protein TraR [Ignavibacteriales bacterium]
MAKKTSTKKPAAKKASPKTAKKKTVLKKAAPKSGGKTIVKKSAKKAAPAKKTEKKKVVAKVKETKKKIVPKKITEKKPLKKMTEKPKKKDVVPVVEVISTAESRAKAIEKIKGYGKKDLEHFKEIILEKRDEIIEQLQNLKDQMLDPTTGEYINENSPYSLHMAEQGTDAMEREKTFLYAQRENKFLGYLEDALKRIEAGTYGICIECIEEPQHLCDTCPLIPKARLEAVPHSQLCLPIKQRQEKK